MLREWTNGLASLARKAKAGGDGRRVAQDGAVRAREACFELLEAYLGPLPRPSASG